MFASHRFLHPHLPSIYLNSSVHVLQSYRLEDGSRPHVVLWLLSASVLAPVLLLVLLHDPPWDVNQLGFSYPSHMVPRSGAVFVRAGVHPVVPPGLADLPLILDRSLHPPIIRMHCYPGSDPQPLLLGSSEGSCVRALYPASASRVPS